MSMAFTDSQQQNAMYKDFVAFSSVYPEVKHALNIAIAKLVRERPVDPHSFIAKKLREINEEMKIEHALKVKAATKIQSRGRGMLQRQNTTKMKTKNEQDKAAAKIQSLGRAKRDRKRVDTLRKANMVWLHDTFLKLGTDSKTMKASALIALTSGDESQLEALDLPDRLLRIPAQFSVMFKRIRAELEEEDSEKDMSWYDFAKLFELDKEAADQAKQEAAAVRIQAIGRKKRDKQKAANVKKMRQRLDQVEEDGLLGYTVNQAQNAQNLDQHARLAASERARLARPET